MKPVQMRQHLRSIVRSSERHLDREGFVSLDRNERVSPILEDVFRAMLNDISVMDLMLYPDAGPFVSLLAERLGMPEENIAECAGSDAAIRRAFMAFLNPGRAVVTVHPAYAMYEMYGRIFQGVLRPVDVLADRRIDVEGVVGAIDDETDVVVFANPNQPTGTAIVADEARRIVARAREVGALCIVDEAYFPFCPTTVLPLVREFDNLLVTRTFSKYPGCAGLRLGYAVGDPALIKGLMAVRGGNEVSSLSLACGRYLLAHPSVAEDFRIAVEKSRQMVNKKARELGLEPLECVTNFQLLRCQDDKEPLILADSLRKQGYLVKVGFNHRSVKNCLRVSLNGPDIVEPFLDALGRAVQDCRNA